MKTILYKPYIFLFLKQKTKKSADCPKCANQCSECVTKATNCIKCKTINDRFDIPTCECKEGLFDDG